MHSRHTHRGPAWLFLFFSCFAVTLAVLITFSLTVQQADAASTHVVVLNSVNSLSPFFSFLLNPNGVFLIFIVALVGIYLEIAHPGTIVPGVIGVAALLLFLFAAGSLSPNWAGLALMILALVLLVLDVHLLTHGVLTIGAVISLVVGSLIFFNTSDPASAPHVTPWVVYVMGSVLGLLGLSLVAFALRARRHRIASGVEAMIGARVIALTQLSPAGRVSYAGENWAAILDTPDTQAEAGSALQITAVDGLLLHVQFVRIPSLPAIQTLEKHSEIPSGRD